MQKRAARVILEADYKARSVKLFQRLEWIPFHDESKILKASLVFNRINGNCPEYMTNILQRNSDIHTRTTRFSKVNLICPKYKRETEGGRSFAVSAK